MDSADRVEMGEQVDIFVVGIVLQIHEATAVVVNPAIPRVADDAGMGKDVLQDCRTVCAW